MDRLQTMRAFVRVVEDGGFNAAARALDVDPAWVTRQVADLERHLGVKLLERTTRAVRLSEAGRDFLARCRDILADLADAEAAVSRSHQDMVGRVRLALPAIFGTAIAAKALARLHLAFPELVVEISVLDRAIDPVAEGFDVVIMDAGFGVSAAAVARPLLELDLAPCAAPAYLARHGNPETPEALAAHVCVAPLAIHEDGSAPARWVFAHAEHGPRTVDVKVALRGNYALGLDATRCGIGIGRLPPQLIADDLASGRLVALLPGWNAGRLSFNLVYPGRRMIPRRVRHVIDAIIAQRDDDRAAPYHEDSISP